MLSTDLILSVFNANQSNIRAPSTFPCLAIIKDEGSATLDSLSDRLRICKPTLRSALTALERAGFISVQRASNGIGGKAKNIYRIKP
jgi:predicted ArsR family transcriptional regulator